MRRIRPSFKLVPMVALFAQLVLVAGAETGTIPFTPNRWDLKDAEVQDYLDQSALTGTAWLKDADFGDGVIEVDLATDRQQSYPAIVFRRQEDGEYEEVYLRPHRAGFYSDAVQYSPVFNGVVGWQLYSGPGFTAGVALPENKWVHIRIEIGGVQARVFVGPSTEPVLVINDLKHGRSKGVLGLQSPLRGSAHFANFVYTAAGNLQFESPPPADPIPGLITDWELSPVTQPFDLAPERYLDGQSPAAGTWLPVKSDASGLVDVARYRRPVAGGASKVWARTVLHARQKESRLFSFGYSDDVSVYLNGRILYRGQSGFKRRDPSFLGIIGWNDTVSLPLEAGENELVLMVTEKFGGWGFMGRDQDAVYLHPGVREVWELSGRLNTPESAAYDVDRKVLYVSNFGDGCVSKISLDGSVVALKWVTGLKSPTGLKYSAGKLYAVERSGVAEIDPKQGVIVARHPIPAAVFINDLAVADDGIIYVTDSAKNCVFRLSGGKSEILIEGEQIGQPNGILVEKTRLLVGVTVDGTIKSVDLKSKQAGTFLTLGPGVAMDGLVSDGKDGYLFSDYYGRIYRADATGRKTLLLDRRGPHQFTADFEYIPEQGLLIVPSLYDQRLTGYRVTAGSAVGSSDVPAGAASPLPVASGPYFGQRPPGKTPGIFAPGILSLPNRMEARLAFSPDGNECFFTVPNDFTFSNVQLSCTKRIDNVWTPQVLAPFAQPGHSYLQPFFSADGSRFYFTSDQNGTYAIWSVERTAQGWGNPQVLPAPVNSASYDAEYSQTTDGTAYVESNRPGGTGKVGVWRIQPQRAGQPLAAEHLGGPMDSGTWDSDPYVSPDGKYLLFSSGRSGGCGGADLYATFPDGKDCWTAPVNLNEFCPGINTGAIEYGPSLSPDGRALFFVRLNPDAKQCDVYWVENPFFDPAARLVKPR